MSRDGRRAVEDTVNTSLTLDTVNVVAESIMLDVVETLALKDAGTLALDVVTAVDTLLDVCISPVSMDVVEILGTLVALNDIGTLVLAGVAAVDILLDACITSVTLDVAEILGVTAVLGVVEILDVAVTLAEVDVDGVVLAGGQLLADSAIELKMLIP